MGQQLRPRVKRAARNRRIQRLKQRARAAGKKAAAKKAAAAAEA